MNKTMNNSNSSQILKENKLLRWQSLALLGLLLLAITLMFPKESQDESFLNHPKAKSLMEEMTSTAGL